MIRKAKRLLTGRVGGRSADLRYGPHESGVPAVTVDYRCMNQTRTYTDPMSFSGSPTSCRRRPGSIPGSR